MTGTNPKRDGLIFILLGSVGFVVLGLWLLLAGYGKLSTPDFRFAYTSARCLMHQRDPYNSDDLMRTYYEETGGEQARNDYERLILDFESRYIYFPTTFAVTVPLALLPYEIAQTVWVFAIAAGFILSALLMWDLACAQTPLIAGALLGFYLVNTVNYISLGNPVGIAVSFCIIAVWCFLRNRFVPAGILCMAISLLLKPHDSAFVFAYFLVAGGVLLKRALQTLALAAAWVLPVVAWVTFVSPHWLREIHSNIAAILSHGGIDDQGPLGVLGRGAAMITDLQSIFGIFRDDPHFYNSASYAVCAVLLLIWVKLSLGSSTNPERSLFLLAAISAITMLPFYHRQYDARLIMLTLPAAMLLWSRRGRLGKIALVLSVVGFALTADLVWVTYLFVVTRLGLGATGLSGTVHIAILATPLPLLLLATAVFYLHAASLSNAEPHKLAGGPQQA